MRNGKKIALITGITGQTGSYLAELLLEKGYEVHGIIRRSSSINTPRIDHLMNNKDINNKTFFTHYGDITDANNINELITKIQPDEVYNLAAQSHVKVSFEIPNYTAMVDGIGTLNILEAVRNHCPKARILQASTSEMFGGIGYNMPKEGYNEKSHLHPRSPYGCSKVYAYWITRNYREAYNLFTCNSFCFNHESPRRGSNFVSKKIAEWCGSNFKYLIGKKTNLNYTPLSLGNLLAYRDWGHAKDYAEAQYLMLQQDIPKDYVIATGETHTVKEFVEACFHYMKLPIEWQGTGVNEIAYSNGKKVVEVNPKYFRPTEVDFLLGDSSKARKELNWLPKYSFNSLVNDMMIHEMNVNSI